MSMQSSRRRFPGTLVLAAGLSFLLPSAGAKTLPPTALPPLTTTACVSAATRLDDEHYQKAKVIIAKAIAFLRTQQDADSGGWSIVPGRPSFPGITALVINGMLMEPEIDEYDPTVAKAIDYLLSMRQEDGGFYDRILPNYNTALTLSALAKVNRVEAVAAIKPAQDFLQSLQWGNPLNNHVGGAIVDESHQFYGSTGYGKHGRPDNSNLQLMLEGLYDSGLDCNTPAFQRAIKFLERTQMLDEVNDLAYADGSRQGGFIYATAPNKDNLGAGESKAGMIDETLADGTVVSRLRCYGSMTYAGFKSYLYAQLDREDVRVQAAYDWIRRNYTLEQNPGAGMQGYYYYLHTFARALDTWGSSTITTINADGSPGATHDWANDLIAKLESLQRPDGSFVNESDRWMEGDPVLVTAYVLNALEYAID